MGRVRTKTVKKAARVIVEKYYAKLTLDFQMNKKIAEEVATIPSKRLRNKIAGFTTHLMKRIQRGYKMPAGKPENEFAFKGAAKDKEFAKQIINETGEQWKTMQFGEGYKDLASVNSTQEGSKDYTTGPEKAAELIAKEPAATAVRACLIFVAALVLVTHAAEDTATVTELADEASPGINAAVGTHQSANSGGVGHGYFNDVANFVGPKYGLPGYKESHTWETDFDLMSPLVFDYRMYRALIRETVADATAMSEEELRTHWMEKLEKEEYDKCPQGHIWFSANEFYAIHKDETVPSFEGPGCKGIVTYFLESGVFTGATIAKHVVDDTRFPTIATKLFDGENQAAATISAAFFQVLPAQHFVTPNIVADFRSTNTFSPARHVTLVFWMQLAPQSEAPNAELFAYGGSNDDMFFRTGFGCTPAAFTQCYFVMVFKSSTKMEYFHTYNDGNFPSMETAFEANKWAHVTMMLTTKNPGHLGDVAEGEGCPCNKNEGDACNAALFLWVNKASISLVDWNDGTNIAYAEEWNQPVHSDIWLTKTYNNAGTSVERRFFVSPPASCASAGTCGSVSANNLLFAFPWHGSYLDGVWFCDFQAIASGAGAFGNGGRRALALDAMYEIMQETAAIACTHDSSGQVVTVTGATGNQPDLANSNP